MALPIDFVSVFRGLAENHKAKKARSTESTIGEPASSGPTLSATVDSEICWIRLQSSVQLRSISSAKGDTTSKQQTYDIAEWDEDCVPLLSDQESQVTLGICVMVDMEGSEGLLIPINTELTPIPGSYKPGHRVSIPLVPLAGDDAYFSPSFLASLREKPDGEKAELYAVTFSDDLQTDSGATDYATFHLFTGGSEEARDGLRRGDGSWEQQTRSSLGPPQQNKG